MVHLNFEGLALTEQHAAGPVLWFTGLSCSGKTTVSSAVRERLLAAGHEVEWLDGDVVRRQISPELGFSKADRDTNVQRLGVLAEKLSRYGVIVLVAAISPYREAREDVRRQIGRFAEIFVDAPLAVCEARDTKGLYKKARSGVIHGFTGVDDPYEAPIKPDLVLKTGEKTGEECVEQVMLLLGERFGISTAGK